jgi:hypothetical protein
VTRGQAATGTRARALRRARAAQAPAEARRQVRKLQVDAALAAYYQAAEQAARIRAAASARAARVTAQAEAAAAAPDAEAARAVAELRALGEVNAEIARMCGISVAAVRKLAAAGRKDTGLGEARAAISDEASVPCVPDPASDKSPDGPGAEQRAGLAESERPRVLVSPRGRAQAVPGTGHGAGLAGSECVGAETRSAR